MYLTSARYWIISKQRTLIFNLSINSASNKIDKLKLSGLKIVINIIIENVSWTCSEPRHKF
jgi:hypothetical protein